MLRLGHSTEKLSMRPLGHSCKESCGPQEGLKRRCRQSATLICRAQADNSDERGRIQTEDRGGQNISDSSSPQSIEPRATTAHMGPPNSESSSHTNKIIAGGAVAFGAALVILSRLSPTQVTLATLQKQSMNLDTALHNGRPTLMEFYASWCEVCNDMVPDVANLKSLYDGKLNFVMLNIENSRWLPEMAEYRVSGVPHFVFLDDKGNAQAATIGRLPKEVLDVNTKALVNGERLPFKRPIGEASNNGAASRRKPIAGPTDHA